MSIKCNYCRNKSQCNVCNKDWEDKFIPNEEVKQFFSYDYCGRRGNNGYVYDWNSTNPNLKPTHWVDIQGDKICPYCGERMLPIQDKNYNVIGHCCICEGARAELEYESKKTDMEHRHSVELQELKKEYRKKLAFCSEKLLNIKQEKERNTFNFLEPNFNHFNTENKFEI